MINYRPIVIDLETFDPYLNDKGTDAHCRRWGGFPFLAGLYYPDTEQQDVGLYEWDDEAKEAIAWLLNEGGWAWYGANIKYDLNWLLSEGVLKPEHTLNNRFYDILIDAPLIDETQPIQFYSLDGQAEHYGLPKKPIDSLLEAAAGMGIKCDKKTIWPHLYKLPRAVVKEYLTHDLKTTWAVAEKQAPLIVENKLERVRELESKLIPILAMMEAQGVKVDVQAAEALYEQAYDYIKGIHDKLKAANDGVPVSTNTSNALIDFVLKRGHILPETPSSTPEKPKYSLSASVLLQLEAIDPLMKDLLSARKAEKIAKDFVKGAILENHHNGRIHGNINQIIGRKEDGESQGVRFGRLSMSDPNLQQVPKRDSVEIEGVGGLGSAMRRVFVAEEEFELMSADFSSQEPRGIIHWCEVWKCPGAKEIGDLYRKDPTISSHDIVAAGIVADLPYKTKRNLAKIINLGKGYEMGLKKLIANLVAAGVDSSQAQGIMDDFDAKFPHVSAGSQAAKRAADKNGYIRTIYGRKIHFNTWESVKYGAGPAYDYDKAYQVYTMEKRQPIRRAFTYRAFNRVIQGSAADQTKAAMVCLWYDHGILPTLQVHDELLDARSTPARAKIFKHVMENVIKLTVPSLTEVKIGPNWKDGVITDV